MAKKSFSQLVTEASLSRVWQHIEKGVPFGMLTAFRGEYDHRQNRQRNKQLEGDLRRSHLGFFHLEGYYVEDFGTEKANPVKEESYFVIGSQEDATPLKKILFELGKKYEQDSVFYFDPQLNKGVLIGTKQDAWPGLGDEVVVGDWHPNKAGEFYSKMKGGRTFMFESGWSDE